MIFFTENIIDATITQSGITVASDYPLTNLNTLKKREQLRVTALTDGYLILDLGSARTCSAICLGGKNWDGSFSLVVGSTDNGSTWDTFPISDRGLSSDENEVFTFTEISKRYWRIDLDTFTTYYDYLSLIFLGSLYQTPRYEETYYDRFSGFNSTELDANTFLIRHQLQDRLRRFGQYKIIGMRGNEVNDFFDEFSDNTNNLEYPFFFKWDDNKYYYVRFSNKQFPFKELVPDENYYEFNYSLIEAV